LLTFQSPSAGEGVKQSAADETTLGRDSRDCSHIGSTRERKRKQKGSLGKEVNWKDTSDINFGSRLQEFH